MKKSIIWTRVLCLLLTLCTVCALFAACRNEGEAEKTKDKDAESTADLYDEEGFLRDQLPGDLDFNKVVRIVVSDNQKGQVYALEQSENVISNAIYKRGLTVEERLGIEIEWHPMDATWNDNRAIFFQHIQSTSNSGDAYDACCLYNLMPGALAATGSLENLGETKYLDLTAPWWPSNFVEEIMINNTLYSLVENSSRGTLMNIHGTFFNEDLIDKYDMESPYQMVKDNTWTFANMMAMVKGTWSDMDNDGVKDEDDFFGVMTGTEAKIETWFYGMGNKYATKNAEGMPEMLMSDVTYMTNWLDEFNAATATNDFLIWDKKGHAVSFFEERAIFYMSAIRLVDKGVSAGVTMNYGVVPVPKKDSNQDKYYTNVANTHDMWCVPLNADDMDVSSALLECMASQAYRQVAPVYFDQCIKLRYAPSPELAEMYDLIRSSIVFDFCSLYSFAFSRVPRTDLHSSAKDPAGKPWTSQWASIGPTYVKEFETILAMYGDK